MGDNLDDLLDYAASCGAPWVKAARAELATLRRKAAALDELRGPLGLTLGDCSPQAVAVAIPLAQARRRKAATLDTILAVFKRPHTRRDLERAVAEAAAEEADHA